MRERRPAARLAAAVFVAALPALGGCADGATMVTVPEPTGTILGRVVTNDGAPLSEVTVTTTPFVPDVRSDDTGHFTIENLAIGTQYRVSAIRSGCFSSLVDVPVTREQPVIAIEFTLLCFG